MSLTGVEVTSEVWLTCSTHALSTETEEIMGLLLGDVEYSADGAAIARIWAAVPQTRSDRRKDRVETNPEQLAAASAEAERLSTTTGRITRVIGWYHSHPHITVLPSHVDVRTQGMYQMLDPGFVGIIFSCFSEDAQKVGRVQAIAFQSTDMRKQKASSPSATQGADRLASNDVMLLVGNNKGAGNNNWADDGDMSSGLQEAMHRSNQEHSGSDFMRKEVPISVVPGRAGVPQDISLAPLVALQRILFAEERAAYHQALSQAERAGKIHPLAAIHHHATYQASLCKLMEFCLSPVLTALADRQQQNQLQLAYLQSEAAHLKKASASAGRDSVLVPPSPSRWSPQPANSGERSDGGRDNSGSVFVVHRGQRQWPE